MATAAPIATATPSAERLALISAHSRASNATPTRIKPRYQTSPNHTAATTVGTSTVAEATRIRRLLQLKRLAGDGDVIDGDTSIATVAAAIFRQRGGQVFGPIVRPQNVLIHEFGVGAFPKQ